MDERNPLRLLEKAREGGYLVGSFSPRYLAMIRPVLEAAEAAKAPVFVQISQMELERKGLDAQRFSQEYFRCVRDLRLTVPCVLHLDHTREFDVIRSAMDAGFASVMMDASAHPFTQNAAITGAVAEEAHARGVYVEGELGRIETGGEQETIPCEELYTVPEEAAQFKARTGIDYLAISIGTVHGVYAVRDPKLRIDILQKIARGTDTPLVMHGGSGLPTCEIAKTYGLISKINIATDLELALLAALQIKEGITDAQLGLYEPAMIEKGRSAVRALVYEKIMRDLAGGGKA